MNNLSWSVLAVLYLDDTLYQSEFIKTMHILTDLGFFNDTGDKLRGYNLLSSTELGDLLVLGLLCHIPKDKPLTYRQLGEILKRHPQTIGGSINRLIFDGMISKQDCGATGSLFTLHERMLPDFPNWLWNFTKALMEMSGDSELRSRAMTAAHNIVQRLSKSRGENG